MSLKETSSVFFRVGLLVLGQVSFSGFAERVFSTCKLVLALNRRIIVGDVETFNNLVILRHKRNFCSPQARIGLILEMWRQALLKMKAVAEDDAALLATL
jgi:hypothetical protein